MTVDDRGDALSDEERKALESFSEKKQRDIVTLPLQERRRFLAETSQLLAEEGKLSKGLKAELEQKLSEFIRASKEGLRD